MRPGHNRARTAGTRRVRTWSRSVIERVLVSLQDQPVLGSGNSDMQFTQKGLAMAAANKLMVSFIRAVVDCKEA
jgi:hypothetical protein